MTSPMLCNSLCWMELRRKLAEREGFESAYKRKLNNMQGHGMAHKYMKSSDRPSNGSRTGLRCGSKLGIHQTPTRVCCLRLDGTGHVCLMLT
jgi:hypothetical protein